MITTLTGNNGFLLKAELRLLVAAFIKKHTEMAVERIDGEESEYDRVRESLESLPFLTDRKLVILRTPGAKKEFIDNIAKLLGELSDTIDIIIYEPKLDKRSVYYKFLKKATNYKEFTELDMFGLSKWLVEQANQQGAKLENRDAKYLVERIGLNQNMLAQELAKLVAYDPTISLQSINLMTEPTPHSTIFQLLDAAFESNIKQMLKIYKEQRASKIEPQQIIAMLAWQFHILAVIKTAGSQSDAQIASEAKLSPFVVGKSRQIARSLSLQHIKTLVHKLAQLDLQLKTTSVNADDGVQAFLLSIAV